MNYCPQKLFLPSLREKVVISGVKAIRAFAFAGCLGISQVIIGDDVEKIGEGAFFACVGLNSVTIGKNVRAIGDNAFGGCTGLISVYNKSSLKIVKGKDCFGQVAYYARRVYCDKT